MYSHLSFYLRNDIRSFFRCLSFINDFPVFDVFFYSVATRTACFTVHDEKLVGLLWLLYLVAFAFVNHLLYLHYVLYESALLLALEHRFGEEIVHLGCQESCLALLAG